MSVSVPADAKPGDAPRTGTLTGQLLVATPEMTDPRFARTVVYIVRHDASGALGLIVNRPAQEVSVASLLDRLQVEHGSVSGSLRMHYGGPVEPGRIFILHSADYRSEATHVVADGIAVTTSPGILRAIGAGAGPRRALLVLSYSGWAPGQLEAELRAGGWVTAPADAALVFDEDYDTKWQRALGRRKSDRIDL